MAKCEEAHGVSPSPRGRGRGEGERFFETQICCGDLYKGQSGENGIAQSDQIAPDGGLPELDHPRWAPRGMEFHVSAAHHWFF
jgi:hypothetical protein